MALHACLFDDPLYDQPVMKSKVPKALRDSYSKVQPVLINSSSMNVSLLPFLPAVPSPILSASRDRRKFSAPSTRLLLPVCLLSHTSSFSHICTAFHRAKISKVRMCVYQVSLNTPEHLLHTPPHPPSLSHTHIHTNSITQPLEKHCSPR